MLIEVTAADLSLYHLAARYLNDARQWWRLAVINGMDDPDLGFLDMPVMLRIPVMLADGRDGVPDI